MKKTIRLDKMLAHMGFGTRSEVKKIIRQKRVALDGKITNVINTQVAVKQQKVTVDGIDLDYQEFFYFIMNKPQGVISATKDNYHQTVIDLLSLQDQKKGIFPVGRLDIDTEGLLLLTNDGKLGHQLLSPKNHVAKTYYARVNGEVTNKDVERLKQGIILNDGYKCMPAHLHIIDSGKMSEIELTIYEGKFHQVKRMVRAIGKEVIYLQRTGMGSLRLPNELEAGSYKKATKNEINLISLKGNKKASPRDTKME